MNILFRQNKRVPITIAENSKTVALSSAAAVYRGGVDVARHLGQLLPRTELTVFSRRRTAAHKLQTAHTKPAQVAVLRMDRDRQALRVLWLWDRGWVFRY